MRASRRCHILHQAHFCLSGKGLWWHALMDSLSKWTLTTSRDGQRNWRRRREKSSFVLPLKVRARGGVAWLGALLSVLSEEGKKGRKQFPSLQCPRLSSPLIVVLLLLLSPSCSPAAWSLPSGKIGPLSPSDRSAALPACVPWQMMHSDGPDEIVLPPLTCARPLVRLHFIEFVRRL